MDTYVITAGTPSHDSLRHQFFEPSLQRCEPVNWIHYQRPSGSNPRGDFGCGDWLEVTMGLIDEHELDVIVTGTHGGKGLKGFLLGSMSEQLVRRASCSVFVVKPQGFPYLRD